MEDIFSLAHAVRAACLTAALRAYEDAGLGGLCHEGRWECAVDAIRTLDLQALVRRTQHSPTMAPEKAAPAPVHLAPAGGEDGQFGAVRASSGPSVPPSD